MTTKQGKEVMVVDVRTTGEYFSGHVEGSENIPLNELMGHTDRLRGFSGEIVFCCASGMRSGSATSAFRQLGFNNVTNAGPWYEVDGYLQAN
jgi:rhodanese-related sulfurtransferase